MQNLINYGIISFNKPHTKVEEKTIIVMGMARSGTSMVARVLDGLGVFLGAQKDNAVFEDVEISQLLEKNDEKGFTELVNHRNQQHKVWGWKRPGSINQIDLILKTVRNPHFVILYRDLLAIALRNKISMESDINQSLKLASETYGKINDFVATTKAPTLLISYEKAIIKKRKFLEGLCEFADIDFPENHFGQIIRLIEQDRPQYVANSTIKKVKGEISFANNQLKVDAKYPHQPNKKVPVEIIVNDNLQKEAGVEQNSLEDLSHELLLEDGINKIEVVAKETQVQLGNSPLLIQQNKTKPIFVFLHIPKTAGTSFRVELEKSLRPNQIFPNTNEIKKNNGQYPLLNTLGKLPLKRLQKIQFIAGHYQKQSFSNYNLPFKFFTFFRNPEDRIISNLIHFKTYDPRCKSLELEEIFDQRKGQLVNLQWKFLLTTQQIKNFHLFSEIELQKLAAEELSKLHFFGIKERFEDSMIKLNKKLKLSLDPSKNINAQKHKYELSKNLLLKVEKISIKEKILYKVASENFSNQ